MGSLLKFEDFGEAASRRFLAGWCGPLVPEEPTAGHDHRKHTLTWTDCQAPGVLEGCVLTFTMSQWHQGAELVFESGTPPGQRVASMMASRRVLSWATAWRWLAQTGGGCGLDLGRAEVSARMRDLCAQAMCMQGSQARLSAGPGLLAPSWYITTTRTARMWGEGGRRWPDGELGEGTPNVDYHGKHSPECIPHFLRELALTLADKIAALPRPQ